jgi:A/G-specific adenine glycosylase
MSRQARSAATLGQRGVPSAGSPAPAAGASARALAHAELLVWYQAAARTLPWRQTRDPYRILVSEVMLQQTQVDRVLPYYQRFLSDFPDEQALSVASQDAIHRAWKGLGYPSRVERLQAACRAVLEKGAGWPTSVEGLRELPGIGPYTAGAVACFAFALPVAVVDTNIARVYARRDALTLPLARERIWQHALDQVHATQAIAYTNALMDLGATICTARQPRCGACPWQGRCASRDQRAVHQATSNPMKVARPRVAYGVTVSNRSTPRLHIVLALIHHAGSYLVAKRGSEQHLGGMWELPGGKREPGEDDRSALAREVREETAGEILSARAILTFSYEYPDRYLTFHVYRCRLFNPGEVRPLAATRLRWVSPQEFVRLAFPPANQAIIQRMQRYHRLPPSAGSVT